jgi:predicted dehydrogenase
MVGGGLGAFIGGVHRTAARLDNRYELVAGVFSEEPQEAAMSARLLHIPEDRAYKTYQQMAEREADRSDRVDVVTIVTPNYLHFPIAKAFAEVGFNLICDKPLATTVQEARELAEITLQKDLIFCVTHNYTGYPMVREARALVANGELGAIRAVRATYSQQWLTTALEKTGNRQAAWRQDPSKGGAAGCIGDIGSHAFNLAAFVTGLEVEAVCAEICTFVPDRRVDDHAQVLIRYRGGARGLVWASQVAPGEDQRLELAVYGERGGLVWQHDSAERLVVTQFGDRPRILVRGAAGMSAAATRSTRLPAGLPEGYFECFANLYSDVADAITAKLDGKPVVNPEFPTVHDGVKVIEFIHACLRSSKAGATWIPL